MTYNSTKLHTVHIHHYGSAMDFMVTSNGISVHGHHDFSRIEMMRITTNIHIRMYNYVHSSHIMVMVHMYVRTYI